MKCKSCRYFIQGEGHSGTCQKRPHVASKRGGAQKINGKPRVLVVSWSHNACKKYEKGGAE